MTIRLDKQEQLVTIHTKDGNAEITGFIAEINGFPVSLFIKPKGKQSVELVVSDIKTGTAIRNLYINPLEFWMADTKEKTLELFMDKLEQFKSFMTPEIIEQIKVKRAAYPEVPKPKPIENYTEWLEGAIK